jgi:hypothetical protein
MNYIKISLSDKARFVKYLDHIDPHSIGGVWLDGFDVAGYMEDTGDGDEDRRFYDYYVREDLYRKIKA